MKEFSLKDAQSGAAVCTREGRDARILCFDAAGKYPIIALIYYSSSITGGIEEPESYSLEGHVDHSGKKFDCNDLMMKED